MSNRPQDAMPVPADLESTLIVAFTEAVVVGFQELTRTELVPEAPYLTRTLQESDAIAAEIVLKRPLPGRIVARFSPSLLRDLTRCYLPTEPLSPEILQDTAGEFVNVIAGQAKTMLKGTPFHFHLSTPRIADLASPAEPYLALPFVCEFGPLVIFLSLAACDGA